MPALVPALVGGAIGLGGTYLNKRSSDKASDSAERGTQLAVDSQNRALDYQMEQDRLPSQFRDAAMQSMGGEYGLTMDQDGNVISDGSTIHDRTMASPFYTGAIQAGNENAGRMASATGRVRGGALPMQLGQNASNAYQNAYNQQLQGLSGFARTPLNTNAIASGMQGIGNTQMMGNMAQGQIAQDRAMGITGSIGQGLNMYSKFGGNFGQGPVAGTV